MVCGKHLPAEGKVQLIDAPSFLLKYAKKKALENITTASEGKYRAVLHEYVPYETHAYAGEYDSLNNAVLDAFNAMRDAKTEKFYAVYNDQGQILGGIAPDSVLEILGIENYL